MAYDRVVDSAKLNGALTATADAIREKTGGSDLISWDEIKGFADAVREIATGGSDNSGGNIRTGFITFEKETGNIYSGLVLDNEENVLPTVYGLFNLGSTSGSSQTRSYIQMIIHRYNKGVSMGTKETTGANWISAIPILTLQLINIGDKVSGNIYSTQSTSYNYYYDNGLCISPSGMNGYPIAGQQYMWVAVWE